MTSSHKVVLLGEGRVGKTSLVLRFCRDTFTEGQPPTIQASCLERALRLGDKTVNLVIWDTAGQERFHALGPIYYRDADAALLVFDITDVESFNKVKSSFMQQGSLYGDHMRSSFSNGRGKSNGDFLHRADSSELTEDQKILEDLRLSQATLQHLYTSSRLSPKQTDGQL